MLGNSPDQRTSSRTVNNSAEGDGSRKRMRAGYQDEEYHKHDTGQFVTETTPDETYGVGVVFDMPNRGGPEC